VSDSVSPSPKGGGTSRFAPLDPPLSSPYTFIKSDYINQSTELISTAPICRNRMDGQRYDAIILVRAFWRFYSVQNYTPARISYATHENIVTAVSKLNVRSLPVVALWIGSVRMWSFMFTVEPLKLDWQPACRKKPPRKTHKHETYSTVLMGKHCAADGSKSMRHWAGSFR